MLDDKKNRAEKARCFHLTLAYGLLDMVSKLTGASGIRKVALSGGVFQNLLLLKMSRELLQKNGFQVLHHVQVPPNDGGLSLGQAALVAMKYCQEI
jgi:hydrogenase maturation protein HypF